MNGVIGILHELRQLTALYQPSLICHQETRLKPNQPVFTKQLSVPFSDSAKLLSNSIFCTLSDYCERRQALASAVNAQVVITCTKAVINCMQTSCLQYFGQLIQEKSDFAHCK